MPDESPNHYAPRDDINNYLPNSVSNDAFVDVDYSPDARESSRSPYESDLAPGPFDEEGEVFLVISSIFI
jgi:hypothetical protein